MRIDKLSLHDFRNYQKHEIGFSDGINVICGQNGKGKTNLLEAVYLLSCGFSFKSAKKPELVLWDSEIAAIEGQVFSSDRQHKLRLELPKSGKSKAWANEVRLHSLSDLSDRFCCIVFSPDDLSLVKGGAAARRALIDSALCRMRPKYQMLLARYKKIIENKTKLLKDQSFELIPEYNTPLAQTAAQIISLRARFCRSLDVQAQKYADDMSSGKEQLKLSYKTSSAISDTTQTVEQIADLLLGHLSDMQAAERSAMQCLVGPHRDDMEIFLGDRSARSFASQGQARSAAIAIKLAERKLMEHFNGEPPVLLLDDVLSELDSARQDFVLSHTEGGQTIITCCDRRDFKKANEIYL